jgi:hypothetical protein
MQEGHDGAKLLSSFCRCAAALLRPVVAKSGCNGTVPMNAMRSRIFWTRQKLSGNMRGGPKDPEMMAHATRLRDYCERRAGEIMEEMRAAKQLAKGTRGNLRGVKPGKRGKRGTIAGGSVTVPPAKEKSLADLGIDKHLYISRSRPQKGGCANREVGSGYSLFGLSSSSGGAARRRQAH